jgi:hypothetical protein
MTYRRDGSALQQRGQRQGVCHRCGWRGIVGKLERRDREILKSAQHYGRLCQECVSDVFQTAPSPQKVEHSQAASGNMTRGRQMAWASARPAQSSPSVADRLRTGW